MARKFWLPYISRHSSIIINKTSMNEANCNNANERAQFGDRFRKLFRRKPKAKASTKRRESYLKKVNITEHKIPIEQFAAFLKTDLVNGLTESEAEERLARNGLNQFTPPETTPEWIKFLKKLFYGFSALLWISLILCLVIFGVADDWSQLYVAIVLFVVVLGSGVFAYFTERKSGKVMDSFKNLAPPQSFVIRNGKRVAVDPEKIVVGDLVLVKGGERIPADIRIIHCEGLKVDNAALTGESEPQSRSAKCTNANPLETKNIAFSSTNCVEGAARGIVIKTGDNTLMGQIAILVSGTPSNQTTLEMEINRLVYIVSGIAVGMAFIFFIIAFAIGSGWIVAITWLVGIAIGNVPEGLLPAMTIALSLTARRMVKKHCLVKDLNGIETFGCTSVICSDKTGTLTCNRMTVNHVWLSNEICEVLHERSETTVQMNAKASSWEAFARCATLCSRTEFEPNQEHLPILDRLCIGDASEIAILKYMESGFADVMRYRTKYPKIAEKPFNSTTKFQLSIHLLNEPATHCNYVLCMKGAPEKIIQICSKILIGNESRPIEEYQRAYDSTYIHLGSMGERVIGLCDLELHADEFPLGYSFDVENINFPVTGLRFLGLVALIDPPRPTVPCSVLNCRSAGIKVVMVTGDHPITAKAIAKSVNIISAHSETVQEAAKRLGVPVSQVDPSTVNAIVITGDEISQLSKEKLKSTLAKYTEIVFARTSPQQKLQIVEACQSLDMVVAVTGDGVNDSPALKRANVGIAMGITGSEVSKQAADCILLDDNFASIVAAIEEGRLVFENLKKTTDYILSGNTATIYPFIIYIIFGFPLALGTFPILLIAFGTDMFPAIALTYEKPESDIMKLPPRRLKQDRMITTNLIWRCFLQLGIWKTSAAFFSYFVVFALFGWWPSRLYQIRVEWEDARINDLVDSYGQEWTFRQRVKVLGVCQASYFIGVVVMQWTGVVIDRTRRLSVFQHGFRNYHVIASIFVETAIAVIFVYVPYLNEGIGVNAAPWEAWIWPMGFSVLLFIFDEARKWMIRANRDYWLSVELNY